MTRKEKCELAIKQGYRYNNENGFIYGIKGKILTNKSDKGYIQFSIKFNNKNYKIYGQHFAWFYSYNECNGDIDHINGIRTDNRIINLRVVTNQENHFNRLTAKGFYWDSNQKKWRSQIRIDAKAIYLGSFCTKEEARNAYLEAKKIYHKINKK